MERKEQKENDLESVKCYKPQNCKMPEMKRKCAARVRVSELKGWELCACHIEAEKEVHR